MNNALWSSILQFDFDPSAESYAFSVRLANENRWTKDFTEKALLEYKKFMYLAAVSDRMVSPSHIVDIVWHQHLIFTQSYQSFCALLGKTIQHVPAMHHTEQPDQFKQASEWTKRLYIENFGQQPEDIWQYQSMLAGLKLRQAKVKPGVFALYGTVLFCVLSLPVYFLLRPVYVHINNPYFIMGLIMVGVPVYAILNLYTRNAFKKVVATFNKACFVYRLKPYELVYLKTQKLADVINGTISELVQEGQLQIRADGRIVIVKEVGKQSAEKQLVIAVLKDKGNIFYAELLQQLQSKPMFRNIANSMVRLQWHFDQSREYAKIFYLNFTVLATFFMFPLIRLIIGMERGKPVLQIAILVALLLVAIINYLYRLNRRFSTQAIPDLYKKTILPAIKDTPDWQWDYFLYGTTVLAVTLVPLIGPNRNSWADGSGAGSCGSSCGSSCGGGCGGCGGD